MGEPCSLGRNLAHWRYAELFAWRDCGETADGTAPNGRGRGVVAMGAVDARLG
jgi:hypothetical protein